MSPRETASTTAQVRMVTLFEFAKLMNVCPNTVRRWMRKEKLKPKEHYFRDGRIIRFPWGEDLLNSLIKQSEITPPKRPRLTSSGRNNRNLKYRA